MFCSECLLTYYSCISISMELVQRVLFTLCDLCMIYRLIDTFTPIKKLTLSSLILRNLYISFMERFLVVHGFQLDKDIRFMFIFLFKHKTMGLLV